MNLSSRCFLAVVEEKLKNVLDMVNSSIPQTGGSNSINRLRGNIDKELSIDSSEVYSKQCKSLLHVSVESGDAELVETLLSRGSCGDSYESWKPSWRLLHLAIEKNYYEIVKSLLDHEAAVDEINENGENALHVAVKEGFCDIAQLLLEKGASVSARYSIGHYGSYSPLHLAVANQQEEMVKLLLSHKFDVNDVYFFGNTALHLAARRKHYRMVELLVDHHADVNAATVDGKTALYIATENRCLDMVEYLLQKGAFVNPKCAIPASVAKKIEQEQAPRMSSRREILLNAADIYGQTPLHMAIENGSLAITRVLMQNGAVVDSKCACMSNKHYTPLHLASKIGHANIMSRLLNHDSDAIDKKDIDGFTPLYHAIINKNPEVMKILVEHGAEISVTLDRVLTKLEEFLSKFRQSDARSVSNSLVKHLVRRQAQNSSMSDKVLKWLNNETLNDFRMQCESEIEALRNKKIGSSSISYLTILTNSVDKLVGYMRNEDVTQALESVNFKPEFPIYAGMMEKQLNQSRERSKLMQQGIEIMYVTLSEKFQCPYVCVERILSYLPNKVLQSVITSKSVSDDTPGAVSLSAAASVKRKKETEEQGVKKQIVTHGDSSKEILVKHDGENTEHIVK